MSALMKMGLALLAGLLVSGGALAVAQNSADDGLPAGTTTTEQGADVSGPCDEAEHADDPRCDGGAGEEREDNSGHGNSRDEDDGAAQAADGADRRGHHGEEELDEHRPVTA